MSVLDKLRRTDPARPASGEGVVSGDPAVAEAEARLRDPGRRGRGRPKRPAEPARPAVDPEVERAAAELREEIGNLFAPEQWEDLACLIADVRLAQTGYKWWDFPKEQRLKLGASLGLVVRAFLPGLDPRVAVALIASTTFAKAYGQALLLDAGERKRVKAEAAKRGPVPA